MLPSGGTLKLQININFYVSRKIDLPKCKPMKVNVFVGSFLGCYFLTRFSAHKEHKLCGRVSQSQTLADFGHCADTEHKAKASDLGGLLKPAFLLKIW
jgi:hypothetical protein